jgi:hypothetical protein
MTLRERGGEHTLKGVPGRWRLLAVGHPADRPQPLGAAAIERDVRLSDRVTLLAGAEGAEINARGG